MLKSICATNSETELLSLRDSNAKLVAALHEANGSIEEWKKQLAGFQEETERLREQVAELEAQSGVSPSCETAHEELTHSEMEALVRAKDEKENQEASQRMKDLEARNAALEERVESAESALASSQDARSRAESAVEKVIQTLDLKINDLSDLRQNIAKLLEK
ncbi:hypothetical protein DNTS_003735 [Danionella cerebrum]|uniref:Homer scaffold protein 2 n=1 Tax=Danionella cerebrum TaxID=2873325 RepID=A0A553N426_9TELE|nr:hypothetical protein DNTS_003735 [Danionella translucida]